MSQFTKYIYINKDEQWTSINRIMKKKQMDKQTKLDKEHSLEHKKESKTEKDVKFKTQIFVYEL